MIATVPLIAWLILIGGALLWLVVIGAALIQAGRDADRADDEWDRLDK